MTRRLLAETNEKHKVAYDRIDAERTAASLALESARADLARHGMDVAKLAEELARTQRISAQLQVKAGFGRSLIRSGYPRVQELNFLTSMRQDVAVKASLGESLRASTSLQDENTALRAEIRLLKEGRVTGFRPDGSIECKGRRK